MGDVICVVGLGYVGLPLAVLFGKKGYKTIGYDISPEKIEELKKGIDRTREVEKEDILASNLDFTSDESKIKEADFVIVCVPTPVDENKKPDLSYVRKASITAGKNIKKGAIVVYESTVYPGVTEEECLPLLEKHSGMNLGEDFKIGYSPERINPGDKEHTIEKIAKVVSGSDDEALKKISKLYSSVIEAGVFEAESIKVAEAAKVIENTQRDLNIALMNELSIIFNKMGIDTKAVLDAAGSKWNFHKYHPGLVGGHCIGIDPYYLTFKAEQLGYNPRVILAGRSINDEMYKFAVEMFLEGLNNCEKVPKKSKVLVMGITFKENTTDTRNSKVFDIISALKQKGIHVIVWDPMLGKDFVESLGFDSVESIEEAKGIDGAILAVAHDEFKRVTLNDFKSLMDRPLLVDITAIYDKKEAENKGFYYKRF